MGESETGRIEGCRGCDYFGQRSFARVSPDTRELIPDDIFLRTFPFCRDISPLPFSFWLDGIMCNPDDRKLISDACNLACTTSDESLFSTSPLIISSGDGSEDVSHIYGMTFHAGGGEMPSLCLAPLDGYGMGGAPAPSPPDWSCLDFMNEAVLIAGPDARVQWANRVARRELFPAGMQEGVAVSAFWKRLLWDDDGTCPLKEFIPVCGKKSPKDIFAEDTRGKFWRIRTGLLEDSGGSSYSGYILTAVEMTEWMEERAKLNETPNTFAAFMDRLPSSAVIMDKNGLVQYCTPPMDDFLAKKGLSGGPSGCTFSPEMTEFHKKIFPEILKKGCITVEERCTEPEKDDQIYQITSFPILHPGCHPLIGSIAVDNTDERKNELERSELAATLAEAQKAGRMGSWEYDDTTSIITFRGICPGTLDIRDEVVSLPLEEFLRSLAPEDALQVKQAVCKSSEDVMHELTVSLYVREDEVKCAAFRARSRTDGITGTVGIIQDVTDKVRAEKARAESEEQFRQYFDNSMSGSMIIEPIFRENGALVDFRFISVNGSFSRMMGVEQEDVNGKTAAEVFRGDFRECISSFRDAMTGGDSPGGGWTCSRDGREFSGYIFSLGESKPYYGCSFIDVSAEREALRILKENDEFLNIIFPTTIEGIFLIDAETHIIQDVNATACDLIGSGHDEIVGHLCREIICPTKDCLCPVTDLGEDVHVSERILRTADGEKIPVLKSVKQVVYRGQKCLIEMVFDLRNIKAAEEALSLAEERYRMVFETSPDGIVITDNTAISEVNPSFAAAIGYLPEDLKGDSILDYAPEYQADGVSSCDRRDELLKKILGGERVSTPWDALSRDGAIVRFEVRGSHVNLLGKTMVILVGRNITELIHLKERQREALDQIEENLANLATLNDHIRNPLMVISGYTEMDKSDHLPVIMTQIREIDGIINTLDRGFLESEKIREFLRKHHDLGAGYPNSI